MPDDAKPDLPPDNGQRASVRPDGTVTGSGLGSGGGQEGEDFDSDPLNGDGYAQTGGEGGDHRPEGLGPKGQH